MEWINPSRGRAVVEVYVAAYCKYPCFEVHFRRFLDENGA